MQREPQPRGSDASPSPANPGLDTIEVGRVLRAHGLRGELIVQTHADDGEALCAAAELILDGRPGAIPHRVVSAAPVNQGRDGRCRVRFALAGLDRRESAELWNGARVRIAAALVEAHRDPDDVTWGELIGMACIDPAGLRIGEVREIWPSAAHDILVICGERGRLLLPAADAMLVRVDRAARELHVRIPDDLAFEAAQGRADEPGPR